MEKYKIGIAFFDESLKLSPTYEDALTWKNKSLVLLLAKINSTNLRVEDGGVVNVIDVNLEGDRVMWVEDDGVVGADVEFSIV